MINVNLKKQLESYLTINGKQNNSWKELYEMFPFKGINVTNKQKTDCVRSVQRLLNRRVKSTLNVNSQLPKILIFDIETAPLLGYVWRLFKQNVAISQLENSANYFILTWSAKWLFDENIMSDKLTSKEAIEEDDTRIVQSMWNLLDEADIVIAHYGKGFDIPMMNNRFVMHRLPPPSPYIVIDTKFHASKSFKFPSNKLDYIAQQFGVGSKIKTDFELWKNCLKGDEKALQQMSTYNDMDVKILEDVYLIMRPYIKPHPNVTLFIEDNLSRCNTCGSDQLEEIGRYNTQVSSFTTCRCKSCGSTSRRRNNLISKDKSKNLLVSIQ